MNRDDIIRMAREAGLCHWGALTLVKGNVKAEIGNGPESLHPCLEAFFYAVCQASAAAEREACAQILDGVNNHANPMTANDCADAIRARGEEPKRHPGYIMGDHWLQAAYTRICTGETEDEVMTDYGWQRESR
jgi:hypothetical protein